MPKITRRLPPKSKTDAAKRVKKAGNAAAKSKAPAKPWTPAEVHEAFSRFRKAKPEPKGELEHLNP